MSQGGVTARSDLRGGVGWMVFGVVIVSASLQMDRFETMGGTVYTAPGLVPGMFGLALIVLGALLAWRGWRAGRALAGAGTGDVAPTPLLDRRTLLALALTLSYAIGLVGRAPFAPSTAVFVAVFAWLYADQPSPVRRALVALATGVLTALVVVLVFERVFLVRLP